MGKISRKFMKLYIWVRWCSILKNLTIGVLFMKKIVGTIYVTLSIIFFTYSSGVEALEPASFFLGETTEEINLDNIPEVFAFVFSRLDDKVEVKPTENYVYYRFKTGGKEIWGNLHLSPQTRDAGLVGFGYYEFSENLTGPEDANAQYKMMGTDDGVLVTKNNNFNYSISYDGKTVEFALNQIEANLLPIRFALPSDEEMVFRLHDESNIPFFLIYNKDIKSFLYVVDEDNNLLTVESIENDLVIEPTSKFVFYVDEQNSNRKILIGVNAKNASQNSYYTKS